jgi:hypothetical protein
MGAPTGMIQFTWQEQRLQEGNTKEENNGYVVFKWDIHRLAEVYSKKIMVNGTHGLIKYTDTKAFVGFS